MEISLGLLITGDQQDGTSLKFPANEEEGAENYD